MKNSLLLRTYHRVFLFFSSVFILSCNSTNNINLQKDITQKNSSNKNSACEIQKVYPQNPLTNLGKIIEIGPPSTGLFPYFEFLEGPVWVNDINGGSLFFSDLVAPARIWKLTPPSTTPTLFLKNSGSNGLAINNSKQLVLADREARRITQVNPNSKKIIEIVPGNGKYKPNDLVIRSDDNLYFTASRNGFYRVTPNGKLENPITVVSNPNGILLAPDENTLFIGDFSNRTITTFKLNLDGSINTASATIFATTTGNKADGMTIDCAGNLYIGTEAGIEVFSSLGAELGIIPTGRASNAAFGGSDMKTLYVTTPSYIKAIKLAIPGLAN